ncbi:aspartic peptidase domain-containing protein [Rutstroemia sp. NJR-2017a BVV2]|nr:aspartic peptidase domain-containing protein [Rutstroemia sp. NJR-2017a BVV2]
MLSLKTCTVYNKPSRFEQTSNMYPPLITTITILSLLHLTTSTIPPIHLPLTRRNGSFSSPSTANLTSLTHTLLETSSRFLATERIVSHNHVMRVPRTHPLPRTYTLFPPGTTPLQPGAFLLGEVGLPGTWFARIGLGEPPQEMDWDLSFLSGDLVVVETGRRFGEGGSGGFREGGTLGLRGCREAGDVLGIGKRGVKVGFALCRPSRSWVGGLGRSGGLVGVAGGEGLRQVGVGNGFMGELQRAGVLDERWGGVWSVVLINGREGVWSIGGTAGKIVREIEEEISGELERLEGHDGLRREKKALNTPFIIGPPSAVRTLYASISGARPLPPPYSHFYSYPCFNAPEIHFEFGSFRAAVMQGARDEGTFSPGGRFSLGRAERGSGFCVGMVVEGVFDEWGEGNGMEDVWVLGEPFFRDVQVAFDWKEKKTGMQKA